MAREFARASLQYLDAGNPSVLNITTGDLTIAAWVMVTAVASSLPSGIVAKATNGSVERVTSLEIKDGTSLLQMELYDGTNNPVITGGTSLSGTGWRHVVGVRNAGLLRLYVDGVSDATAVTDNSGNLSGGTVGQVWRIGSRADNFGNPIDARIAEVGIWTAALSTGEIGALARKVPLDQVRSLSLVSYVPVWGIHSPEVDLKTPSTVWTLTNTPTAANHAPVTPWGWDAFSSFRLTVAASPLVAPYNRAGKEILDRTIDLAANTLKVMLVTSTYVANPDHLVVDAGGASDPLDAEIGVSGYTRQTLTSKTITQDDTNDRTVFTAASVTWTSLAAGATVVGAILIKDAGGADSGNRLIAYYPLTSYPTTGNGLTLTWDANGMLNW